MVSHATTLALTPGEMPRSAYLAAMLGSRHMPHRSPGLTTAASGQMPIVSIFTFSPQ
jgi:hypothetical protein